MCTLFKWTDDEDAEIPECVRKEKEKLENEFRFSFFDEVRNVYITTDFFRHLCHREVWAIESGFAALLQELRAIAFHHAVLINRADILKAVLCAASDLKQNVNTDFVTDVCGNPLLMTACYHGCRRSFLTLVKDGKADLSVCDNRGRSLAYACINTESWGFVQWAKQQGVVFNVNDSVDALIPLAAEHNVLPILRWLIEDLGGNVNIIDEYGCSALDNACLTENREVFLYLLNKGAKMTDKREALIDLIIDQIKELQKQPPSKIINARIHHHINTLHFLMTKA